MIDAIVADPEDELGWLVYGDWLLERGHPRGELIQLAALAAAGDQAAAWRIRELEDDEVPLLSPQLAAHARQWRFEWKRGFIDHAELMNDQRERLGATTIGALCEDPHAALLASLAVDLSDGWEVAVDPHTGRERSRPQRRPYDIGNVDRALAHLHRLETLGLHGAAFDHLGHAAVRSLGVDGRGVTGRFELPRLAALSIERADETHLDRVTLLQAPPAGLVSLRLHRFDDARIVSELARAKIVAQLELLDLGKPPFGALIAMIEHASAFARIPAILLGTIVADLSDPVVTEVRRDLERLFGVNERAGVRWIDLHPEIEDEPEPETEPDVDDRSRTSDGRIDPIGAWIRARPRRPRSG